MLRSILMTSGEVTTMWRSEEKPAPTSSMASRRPAARKGARASREGGVVLDLVVLGQLEEHAIERQPGQQLAELGREQGGGGDVHRDVAADAVEMDGGRLEGEQLQPVAQPDAVRLREADVGGHAPLGGEAAERLGAHPPAGGEVDDRLQDDDRAARGHERVEPVGDLGAAFLRAHLGLDDHGGGGGEDVHQGLVALGQVLVRRQPGRAEGAVERAVAEGHGHRDVAAQPRHAGRRQLHRLGEVLEVGDDLRAACRRGRPGRGSPPASAGSPP